MELKSQQKLYDQVVHYLKNLGYSIENIQYEVPTISNKRVDIFLQDTSKSIAIEVKRYTDIFNLDPSELTYHPVVRMLQQNAIDLDATYYIVSDGNEHLWFETGSNGRPVLIDPIIKSFYLTKKLHEVQYLNNLLDHVSNFLENFPLYGQLDYDFSLALYAKLCSDLKKPYFRKEDFQQDSGIISEVLYRWSDINFLDFREEILLYIDKFLSKKKQEWQVPRWLANFMSSLYPFNLKKNKALDLFARHGSILSALNKDDWKKVEGIYFNKYDEYWLRIQSLLITNQEPLIEFRPDLLDSRYLGIDETSDAIFLAPPFGIQLNDGGDSLDLLLEKAIQIVSENRFVIAVVNDGYLFSGRKNILKKSLGNTIEIKGIIKLPSNTFKPKSQVSTSLVIIQKKTPTNDETFFGRIEIIPENDQDDGQPLKLLSNWQQFFQGNTIKEDELTFKSKLNPNNLNFSHYWLQKFDNSIQLDHGFDLIPLVELIFQMKRGGNIKQATNGEVAFLAPAAIRQMEVIDTGLSYTDPSEIKYNYPQVDKGDILVNIIGTQRGKAAIAGEWFDGFYFNHHLICIKPNPNIVVPEYLAIVLNSDFIQQQFAKENSATIIPSLNLGNFERLSIPVPNRSIQEQICKTYFTVSADVAKKEKDLNTAKRQLSDLLNQLGKENKI